MCKVTLSLKEYDKLDGPSNFVPRKLEVQILMDEANLWKHVEDILEPANPAPLVAHQKKEARVNKTILDSEKDRFLSHISDKTTSKKMFDSWLSYFKTRVLLNKGFCETNSQLFA
jgi:hypothetical protein